MSKHYFGFKRKVRFICRVTGATPARVRAMLRQARKEAP